MVEKLEATCVSDLTKFRQKSENQTELEINHYCQLL